MLYSLSDYVLKYSSYKTLKCYKLVFSINYFIKNIGSIIILILISLVIGFLIFFLIKGISPLKLEISKIWFKDQEVISKLNQISELTTIKNKNKNKSKNKSNGKKIFSSVDQNPPRKKLLNNKLNNNVKDKEINLSPTNNTNNHKLNNNITNNKIIIDGSNVRNISKNQENIMMKNNNNINANNNDLNHKKYIKIEASGSKSYYLNMNITSNQRLTQKKVNESNSIKQDKTKKKEKKRNNFIEQKPKKSVAFRESLESISEILKRKEPRKEKIILDDYELNNLEYLEALLLDKRNCCKIYCSLLMRNQLIMNTFLACDDYNLFYIKVPKFIFILCTLMTLNAFFFSDKSLHKLFISGVSYYFNYQILQIIFSVIINYFVETFLCFFTFTDKYIYEIKSLQKKEINRDKIFDILNCIRIKLIIFYCIIFVILLFCWYSVSAFCAVYPNTQKIFLIDFLLSILFLSLIPFIVYAIMTIFRVMSLKDKDKKRSNCSYKLSQFFPFF